MTSSASHPGSLMTGMRKPSQIRKTNGIACPRSSGMASRCALYSAYSSWRWVGPGASKTTAMWLGWYLSRISRSVEVNTNGAAVLTPAAVVGGLLIMAK